MFVCLYVCMYSFCSGREERHLPTTERVNYKSNQISRFFRVKPIGRWFFEVQKKSGNHTISYQSLLLSTTVLNDNYTAKYYAS